MTRTQRLWLGDLQGLGIKFGHELNHLEIALSRIQEDDMKMIVFFIVDDIGDCVNLQFVSGRVLLYYVIIVYLRIIRKRIETYILPFLHLRFFYILEG